MELGSCLENSSDNSSRRTSCLRDTCLPLPACDHLVCSLDCATQRSSPLSSFSATTFQRYHRFDPPSTLSNQTNPIRVAFTGPASSTDSSFAHVADLHMPLPPDQFLDCRWDGAACTSKTLRHLSCSAQLASELDSPAFSSVKRDIDQILESTPTRLERDNFTSALIISDTPFQDRGFFPLASSPSFFRFFAPEDKIPSAGGWYQHHNFSDDNSFNDSGLHLPLGNSLQSESWNKSCARDHRIPSKFRLPPQEDPSNPDSSGLQWRSAFYEIFTESDHPTESFSVHDQWSFDEKLVISLLREMDNRGRKDSNQDHKHRITRARLFSAASQRVLRATRRWAVEMFRRL